MVREMEESDVPMVLDIGRRFHAFSPWSDLPYSDDVLVSTLARMSASPDAVVLTNGTGVLGGVVCPVYFGDGLIAQELFWFADKNGRELLDAFEAWAKDKGAAGVLMISLAVDEKTDGRMERLYGRRGYGLRERNFYKGLN